MATKTYSLSNVKQLVDLNEDSTNFEVTFHVASKDGSPFKAIVVDQTMLDGDDPLQYKIADDGTLSGTIVADKGVYQNYFLCMKTDGAPCDVHVTLDRREISDSEMAERSRYAEQQEQDQQEREEERIPQEMYRPNGEEYGTGWKMVFGAGAALVLVAALYVATSLSGKKQTPSFTGQRQGFAIPTLDRSSTSLIERVNNL